MNGTRPRLTKVEVKVPESVNVPSLVLEVNPINIPVQQLTEQSDFSKKFLLNFGIIIVIICAVCLLYVICSEQMSENVYYEPEEYYTIKPYNFMG